MDISNLTGVFCPYPLVYAQPTDNYVRWVFEPLNCAVRCPANTYTEDEWILIERSGLFTAAATLVGSAAIFAYQCYYFWANPLLFCRLMFLLGFFLTSIVMVCFASINGIGTNDVTCEGHYAAIQHSSFCEFQACAMIFLVIWTEMWSLLMALECYLYVSSAASGSIQAGKLNNVYLFCTVAISSACAFIPLGAGNLGYDIEATAPFCFYMVSDTTDYLFATLIYPFMAIAFGCIVLTCATIYKIQKAFVLHEKYTYDRQSRAPRETEFTTFRESTQPRITTESIGSEATPSVFFREGHSLSSTTFPPHYVNSQYEKELRGTAVSAGMPALGASSLRSSNPTPTDIHETAIGPPPRGLLHSVLRLAAQTWRYSGRQLVFVITFVMATAFIVPTMFHVFGHKFEDWVDGTEQYAACLFLASVQYSVSVDFAGSQAGADSYAQSVCGHRPDQRVSLDLVLGVIVWYSTYGLIFPILVFVIASDRFQNSVRGAYKYLTTGGSANIWGFSFPSASLGSDSTAAGVVNPVVASSAGGDRAAAGIENDC